MAATFASADDDTTHIAAADTDSTDEAAADTAPAGASLIEEIVVSGTRDDTTLKDTSHSVVVFTEEQLKLGTEQTMVELFPRIPNVTTDPFHGTPIVRGMAEQGIDRGVTVLPNNISLSDGFFVPWQSALWDTRQAEFQRGPENFKGGGGMGGLDATLTNEPSSAANGIADLRWAPDSNNQSVGFAYGGPVTDRLMYRVAVFGQTDDGFTSNPTRGDHDWNSASNSLARLKLLWEPFGDTDTVVHLRMDANKVTTNGSRTAVTGDPGFDPFKREDFSDAAWRDQDEWRSLNGEFDHRFDDHWHMDMHTSLIEAHLRTRYDLDGTAQEGGTVQRHRDGDYAGIEMRLFYDDGPWQAYFRQYFLYLDLSHAHDDILVPFDYDGPGPAAAIQARLRFHYSTPDWWFIGTQFGVSRSVGRFTVAAALLRSGQTLQGTRGVTSSRITTSGNPVDDAIYDAIILANPDFFPQAGVNAHLNDFNYLPTVETDYAVTDAVTVGAKYERSARLAGVWFNPVRGLANTFDDEISDSYDAFVRSSAFDGRLTMRANLFYTRITGQQVYASLSDTPNDAQILNAQRSHNDGLEIETTWTQGGLNAWLSVGLLEAKFDRVEVGDANFNGNDFPDAPPWTLSYGLTYQEGNGLFAEADVSMRPETRGDLENHPYVVNERRTLVNARLGWAFRRVGVSLYTRNLFDDRYLDYHDSNPAGPQTYVPGDPREVGLTISAALGAMQQ